MGAATCGWGQSPAESRRHSEEEEGRSPARTALSRVQWCPSRANTDRGSSGVCCLGH